MERNRKIQLVAICTQVLFLVGILILGVISTETLTIPLFVWTLSSITLVGVLYFLEKNKSDSIEFVESSLTSSVDSAFDFASMGMLTYDKSYTVTWMSDMFYKENLDRVGKKLLNWLPECSELIQGESDEVVININETYFEVKKKEDERTLFFRNISKYRELKNSYDKEQLVLGIIYLDNYDEATQYEDEQEKSYINGYIRQPVIDWCNNHGMVVKSIQSNRFFVVLNEDILKAIIEDRFSILSATKRSSKHIDVLVTVSMAFARGSNNIKVLDETCNALLELAQSRGGDQVVMRKVDEDIQFFGGNSEAVEKRSKVRVRIMAHTFRDLIVKSSNVIICGHKEMDADCVGAALAMSNIVQLYRKQVSIVSKTGGIEPVIQEVMKKYDDVLSNKHQFVTESEGLNQLQKDTLVIMVDHHDIEISNGKSILSQANKIAIVDHHRRKVDLQIQPILIYVEPGSSSTTELINEFIPYFSKTIDYTQEEANIMYLGLIIDTNNFVARTGSRTFDIASVLRQQGADPILCNQLLKEPYDHFAKRSTILSYAKQDDEIIIALVDNQNIYSRTLISQAANQLLAIKNVEAVFVGAYVEKNIVAISARSLGNINVQVIMEKMHGGGHLTQAATQIQNQSIAEINKELEKALKEYKMEEVENESNLID